MNIAILSRNPALYSTNSLYRAALRMNHKVSVLDYMNIDIVIENNDMRLYYHDQELENLDIIIPRIGASYTTYGASVVRQFELTGVTSTLSSDSLLKARDKVSCLQILAAHGIRVPMTIHSNNTYMYDELLDEFERNEVVLKLVNGTHGIGVILAENKKLASSILEAFQKNKQKVLMQEYIKESKGADIRVFIVDGEIVGSMKRQARPGEFRSNLHRGGSSSLISLKKSEERAALEAVECLGLKVAGVDMLQSNDGPLILEVNASPGLEGIETTTKNDIAGRIINFAEREAKRNNHDR